MQKNSWFNLYGRFVRVNVVLSLATLVFGLSSVPSARAQAQKFYADKQLNFLVGSRPGGSYDAHARLLAPMFKKYLPGNPTVVVNNMPGGGGLLSSNHLFNLAAKDGTVIGLLERGAAMAPLLSASAGNARFDPLKFHWIGSPGVETGIILIRQPSPIKSFADLMNHKVMVASTTRTGLASIYPRLINGALGTKFEVIEGYRSSGEMLQALERGEVGGYLSASTSGIMRNLIAPWVRDGQVTILAQLALRSDPAFSPIPLLTDFVKDPDDKAVFQLAFTQLGMAFPIAAPPGVPADRVQLLRSAFESAVRDPEYLAAARKMRIDIDPVSAAEVTGLIKNVYGTPPALIDRYIKLLGG